MFRLHPDVTRKTPVAIASPSNGRRIQVVLERLRTGSAMNNSVLKHIHPGSFDGFCTDCNGTEPDSAEHRILWCSAHDALRKELAQEIEAVFDPEPAPALSMGLLVGLLDIPQCHHRGIVDAFASFLTRSRLDKLCLWTPLRGSSHLVGEDRAFDAAAQC